MTNIWLGLFSGIAFGFVIQRIGATDDNRMARSHFGQCMQKKNDHKCIIGSRQK